MLSFRHACVIIEMLLLDNDQSTSHFSLSTYDFVAQAIKAITGFKTVLKHCTAVSIKAVLHVGRMRGIIILGLTGG